jgi:hypothetical protein
MPGRPDVGSLGFLGGEAEGMLDFTGEDLIVPDQAGKNGQTGRVG